MRVPLYRQRESNDCGPACIQMITAYYNKPYNLKTLREYCNVTRIGSSMRDVVHCLETIGFKASSVNINLNELRRMPLPSIIYLKHGHFIVLEKIKKKGETYKYSLLDPSYGKVKMSENKFIDKWMVAERGFGVIMAPKDGFEQISPEIETLNDNYGKVASFVKTIIHKYRTNFVWMSAMTLIVLIANWAMPLLLQKTIDDGITQKDIHFVWLMLISQFAFFIGYMISDNITDLISAKTSIKINIDFISRYLSKIIKLPMEFFDVSFRSDLIQRLSDQSRINGFITNSITSMVFVILNVIVFSGILLWHNYVVFLIFAAFSIVSVVYNMLFLRKRKHLDYSFFSAESERRNAIYELVMGMPEIKINNAQKARVAIWKKLEDNINSLKMESIYLDYYMSNGSNFLSRLRDIVLTGMCAFYVIEDSMTIGVMMMISFVLGQLSGPVSELVKFSRVLQDAKLSYERLSEIYDKPDEDNGSKTDITNETINSGICFKGASFKYAGSFSPYVLQDINLNIPIGKTTAIVGVSGSGKTTLLKLILGFYYPNKGDIFVDNQRMSEIDLDSWRKKCGVVMQNGFIFSGSIAENIALSDETPNIERLKYAAKFAHIDKHIESLPMGYNTRIGESGVELSGGEKQRIYIARAVYRDPEFILFDEATSSLDSNNEKAIMEGIDLFRQNKTVVIIAHRLSTIKNADNIVFLDNGKIIEEGTHEQLLECKGAYYHLVKNQLELSKS